MVPKRPNHFIVTAPIQRILAHVRVYGHFSLLAVLQFTHRYPVRERIQKAIVFQVLTISAARFSSTAADNIWAMVPPTQKRLSRGVAFPQRWKWSWKVKKKMKTTTWSKQSIWKLVIFDESTYFSIRTESPGLKIALTLALPSVLIRKFVRQSSYFSLVLNTYVLLIDILQ